MGQEGKNHHRPTSARHNARCLRFAASRVTTLLSKGSRHVSVCACPAIASNAALSMAKHNDLREGKCHWCSHECGHLRHVLWECPLNPAPCLPQNPLELLGWCNQPYLQNHLIKTIQEIWDVRHDGPT